MTLRCWLFGHNWGPWYDPPDEEYDDHMEDVRSACCTRCDKEHVQYCEVDT